MTPRLKRAHEYARACHAGQKRKYTEEPYYESHLCEVASIVAEVTSNEHMIIAALLHDVVEDTDQTIEDVHREFGHRVAVLVDQLTDVSSPEDGNRAIRKEMDRKHLIGAEPDAQTVKLADLISNTRNIVERDPKFGHVYLREKEAVLKVLQQGDPSLLKRAEAILAESREKLGL